MLDKLGVKPGQRVSVLGINDSAFLKDLAGRVPDFSREAVLPGVDLIFLGAENIGALKHLKALARAMLKNGAIWAVYPKGQKHIREVDVINAGKAAGLTDNKVARFSGTHTALRFVVPVAKR